MSRIDVEHRADGISLILASHGFSMSVELSRSEADDLLDQLVSQQAASTGPNSESKADGPGLARAARETSRAGCQQAGSE